MHIERYFCSQGVLSLGRENQWGFWGREQHMVFGQSVFVVGSVREDDGGHENHDSENKAMADSAVQSEIASHSTC